MEEHFNLRPMRINLSEDASRMISLVRNTRLPDGPVSPGPDTSWGIELQVLKELRQSWLDTFDWEVEQAMLNKYNHYLADIEDLTIHFVHHKSEDPDAIPLLLLHGWPSSFLEYLPLIEDLTRPTRATASGKYTSFHVIIPSIPGFAFSSPALHAWTTPWRDTARVFHTLMTEVLGYGRFAVHGSDWGSAVGFSLYDSFSESTRALHLVTLPFPAPTAQQMAEWEVDLDPLEKFEEAYSSIWATSGFGYSVEQRRKPSTLPPALQDNPVGQLAWLAKKGIGWSDPRKGMAPSTLGNRQILLTASLYFLTRSFASSTFFYAESLDDFGPNYRKAQTDAPLLYSTFKYNVMFWPRRAVEQVGNLKVYRNHQFGGHFPAVDNPAALIADLRDIASYWETCL